MIHHRYTDEVVCPHCGHEHKDSHEFFHENKDHADANCEMCGQLFEAFRDVVIEYCTEKKRPTAADAAKE